MQIYAGIDPGKAGALALVWGDGIVHGVSSLPLAGKDLDLAWLKDQLTLAASLPPCLVAIESNQGRGGWGATQTFSMGRTQGQLEGLVHGLGIPLVMVKPKDWQKVLKVGGGGDKSETAAWAIRRWPDVAGSLRKSTGSFHDGLADALAIAEWCRITYGGKQ
jgi:hypothetical protein